LRELLLTERLQAIRDDILRFLGDYCGDFSAPQTKISAARPSFGGRHAPTKSLNLTAKS